MQTNVEELPITKLLDLDGHTALVTGAAGHIGRGIARRLAEAGASVLLHCRWDASRLERLQKEIASAGGQCRPVVADLDKAGEIAAMFDGFSADGVCVDLLVNNAAIQPVEAFEDISAEGWRAMQRSNLDSAFIVTRHAALGMKGRGGAIVNVASIEGLDPAEGHAHYAASKAGLIMLTRAAAQQLGGDGIRVNSVSPGLIDREGLARDWPDGVGRWRTRAPLRRLGRVSDVADAVLFLLSPAARWITGANLVVDGGMSCVSRW